MANWGKCPKCGYEGHNHVYHWGTHEIECDKCGHDYLSAKWAKQERQGGDSFGFGFGPKSYDYGFCSDGIVGEITSPLGERLGNVTRDGRILSPMTGKGYGHIDSKGVIWSMGESKGQIGSNGSIFGMGYFSKAV